jgi:hypothetical protein
MSNKSGIYLLFPHQDKEHTMTCKDGFTLPTELLDQVAETGLDFLPELIYCCFTIHA